MREREEEKEKDREMNVQGLLYTKTDKKVFVTFLHIAYGSCKLTQKLSDASLLYPKP